MEYTFHLNIFISMQIKKMTIDVKTIYEWAVKNIDAIQKVLKFLYDNRNSPEAKKLYEEGVKVVAWITKLINWHKYFGMGGIILSFAPNILNSFANWLYDVRSALNNVSIKWNSDIGVINNNLDGLQLSIPSESRYERSQNRYKPSEKREEQSKNLNFAQKNCAKT